MKYDDFVLVVLEVLQGFEQLIFCSRLKHVTEQDDQRALVYLFSYLMQNRRNTRGSQGYGLVCDGRKLRKNLIEVGRGRLDGGQVSDFVIKKTYPDGIALPIEQVREGRSRIGAEADFRVRLGRVIHRRGYVDGQQAPQVCLFLVTFRKQLVRPGVHLPIDVPGTFAFIVKPVFRKFDRKTVVGRLMESRQKTLHHLPGQDFETDVLFDVAELNTHALGN